MCSVFVQQRARFSGVASPSSGQTLLKTVQQIRGIIMKYKISIIIIIIIINNVLTRSLFILYFKNKIFI